MPDAASENLFGEIKHPGERISFYRDLTSGVWHRHQMDPMQPGAADQPVLTVHTRLAVRVTRLTCVLESPLEQEIGFKLTATHWDLIHWDYRGVWQVRLPAQPAGSVVRYRIRAELADGTTLWADDGEKFAYLVDPQPVPDWVDGTVGYQIFPDRFSPGQGQAWRETQSLDDVYGGTLRGIIENFEHIAALGFNAIWLTPFFPDTTSHGYHASDYFTVNPRMGTLAEIRELVDLAHAHEMRMILDFVANHWGSDHPYFEHAQQHADSEYRNWFYWNEWPHTYEMYFSVRELPKLNVDDPAMRAHLFESVRFWLTEVGFDALRLDHANGPAMNFWTELRAFVQQIKPDAWLFGEVVAPPDELLPYEGKLHGCFDFMLVEGLRETFALGTRDAASFDALLAHLDAFYPPGFTRPTFLDNHDMDRFGKIAGGDARKLKAAALCIFTLPQVPFVYYGTEVGVGQRYRISDARSEGFAECRQPMLWGPEQDQDLLAYFDWLVHFRRAHPVIWQGERRTLLLDGERGQYAYAMVGETESVLAVFNLSDTPQTLTIHAPILGPPQTIDLEGWGSAAIALPR